MLFAPKKYAVMDVIAPALHHTKPSFQGNSSICGLWDYRSERFSCYADV
jgi:hypothetical protein